MKTITKQSVTFKNERTRLLWQILRDLAFCLGTNVLNANKQTERLFELKNSILTYIFKAD